MKTNLIFDLGFHSGQDTNFYLQKGFDVIGIDANPALIAEGEIKFKSFIQNNRLKLLNIGIGNKNETLPFYVNKNISEFSSFDKQIGTGRGDYEVINVPVATLKSIVDMYGIPYYLKIDIEGFDLIAIKALREVNIKPQYLSAENGNKAMVEELSGQGYKKFKFVNQATIKDVRLPSVQSEGLSIEYKFPFGASGPFGNDIAGDWYNQDEIIDICNNYWQTENLNPSIHGWFDLHASL